MNLTSLAEFFGLIASLIAIYYSARTVINLYFKKSHIFEFDTRQTFFAKFEPLGFLGISFYAFDVINNSDRNIVIKCINLVYEHKNKIYEVESHVLIPSTIISPHTKRDTNCIIVLCHKERSNMVLMGWDNLRTKIGNRIILEPNGVLSASAFYVLDGLELKDINSIQNMSIKIIDYSGRSSLLPIILTPEIINTLSSQFEISNLEYQQSGERMIPKQRN